MYRGYHTDRQTGYDLDDEARVKIRTRPYIRGDELIRKGSGETVDPVANLHG